MGRSLAEAGMNVKIKTEQHNPAALGRTGNSPAGPKSLVRVPRSRKTKDHSTRRERSSVRVSYRRLGVVIGEWVPPRRIFDIEPGLILPAVADRRRWGDPIGGVRGRGGGSRRRADYSRQCLGQKRTTGARRLLSGEWGELFAACGSARRG